MGIHLVIDVVMVLCEQGVSCGRGCGSWGCVDEGVGVECGGREVFMDEVYDSTFLP